MRGVFLLALTLASAPTPASAQDSAAVRDVGDSVTFRFLDTDLRAVIQALGRYLDRPVVIGAIPQTKVTAEAASPVARSEVARLLRGVVESSGVDMVADSTFYRFQPRQQGYQPPVSGASRPSGAPVELFVLRLKHARAASVAATIASLFGITASASSPRELGGGTLGDELRRNAVPAGGSPPTPAAPGAGAGQTAVLQGSVTVVADELTNSLLIRASQADYQLVSTAVQSLDLRPLQALIEVLIVEVRRDRAFSLGAQGNTADMSTGSDDGTLKASLNSAAGLGDFALSVMKLGRMDLDGVLRTAVSRGDAKIVSRPVLLASNNREARILVGSQRPFVQVSRSLPTETPTRDQVVQYKDVGTKLTVVPTINEDGYVSLLIRQEVNSATSETQFDAPVISTREAETEVLVRDSQTVVLGGLRERQNEIVKTGIPILSSLPLLGGLFGSENRRTTETELFLFITPIILADDASATGETDQALDRVKDAGIKLPEQKP